MTDPQSLRPPLMQLLNDIESKDGPQADAHTRALIEELDIPISERDPRGGDHRNIPVPFSGLRQAVVRELRSAARQASTGNWAGAAHSVREALGILPETH